MILLLLISLELQAQNNGIYNGGIAAGWTTEQYSSIVSNSIFTGGQGQGYHHFLFSIESNSSIYAGGPSDGFHVNRYSQTTNGRIFAGGRGDGDDMTQFEQESNNSIFAGGREDGYDRQLFSDQTHGEIFVGGSDDGYSSSGLSKLIWTGAIDKDWLMAGNWNLQRIPTISDQATIAGGAANYPLLTDKLQVGIGDEYIYVCNSLEIFADAELNGTTDAWFENNMGTMEIAGTMTFYKNPNERYINKSNSIISILSGGEIHIIH